MKSYLRIFSVLILTSLSALADYADAVWLDYQENLAVSGDVLMTDIQVEETALYTYYAGLVWNTGYMGLQRGGAGYFKHVHFSVWDPPDGVAEVVWAADGVVTERFGGEGTGWKSMWPFNWEENVTYRLCVALVNKQSATEYAAYFFDPAVGEWKHLATFRRGGEPLSFSYVGSFVEDFGSTANERRSCFFGNAWMRTFDLRWIDLRTARYVSAGSKTNKDAVLVGNMFRLETGGNTVGGTPSGTVFVRAAGTPDPIPPGLVALPFDYVNENGAITITKYTGPGGDVVIPETILGLPVAVVGDGAFRGCQDLTQVTLPESITFIGRYAFAQCTRLRSITLPDSVTNIGNGAFYYCSKLTSVTFGKGLSSTGTYAFSFTGLTGVTIPEGITSIDTGAFFECISLTQVTIPDSVTLICDGAFGGCASLVGVTIPDGVTEIGTSAFYGCASLTTVKIGKHLVIIGDRVFNECPNLEAFDVDVQNAALSSMDGVLFNGDQTRLIQFPFAKAGSYLIPNTVSVVGERAFQHCTHLANVTIPDSVAIIEEGAFAGCTGLTDVQMGNGVTSIGSHTFMGCESLTHVAIPEGVSNIGTGAFAGCSSLTSLTIPKGIISIGRSAFSGCTGLSSITMPDSVTSIGDYAFHYCINLSSVYFEGNAPILDGAYAFDGTSATIYYMPGASGWGPTFGGRPTAAWDVEAVTFEYRIDNGTITITGYTGPGGDLVIPDTIGGLPVTGIGSYAFKDCSGLSSVAIPSSVTNMDVLAFGECTDLAVISVAPLNPNYSALDGVLFDKNKLTLLRYPAGKSGTYAIPTSVTRIEIFAFHLCAGLTSIDIPNSVDTIPEFTFNGCSGLTNVTLPDSLTLIGDDAFEECTSLTSITIPDSVTTIGWVAFMGCTNLTSVTIGSGVTKIGYSAFCSCSALTSLTIPESVKRIESWAFNGCTSLTAVYFEGDAPMLGGHTFYGTSATIYYLPGTSGWGATFGGRPTMPWGVVWGSPVRGDVTGDEVVDRNDLDLVVASRSSHAVNSQDPRDLDGDGMITVLDARILVTLFTVPGGTLQATSSPDGVVLEWDGAGGTLKLQSTTDLQSGNWQDLGGIQSSTHAVIGTSAEHQFFRLVPSE